MKIVQFIDPATDEVVYNVRMTRMEIEELGVPATLFGSVYDQLCTLARFANKLDELAEARLVRGRGWTDPRSVFSSTGGAAGGAGGAGEPGVYPGLAAELERVKGDKNAMRNAVMRARDRERGIMPQEPQKEEPRPLRTTPELDLDA